jgi:hypothetical protein
MVDGRRIRMPRGAGEDKGAVSQLAREREKKRCGIISSLAESSPLSFPTGVECDG